MGIIKTIGFQGSLTGYAVTLLFLKAAPHSTHAREDKLHCFHANVIGWTSEM